MGYKHRGNHGSTGSLWAFTILLALLFLLWAGLRVYHSVTWNIEVSGHLKRAADANTVEMARKELTTAVTYLEGHRITTGYTSVLYRTPDEDVEFWYQNLKASLGELMSVKPDASQLERSNVLMKLRETILDQGRDGTSVTVPDGISVFPHNKAFAWFGWLSTVALCRAFVLGLYASVQ